MRIQLRGAGKLLIEEHSAVSSVYTCMMKLRKFFTTLLLAALVMASHAQEKKVMVKITDLEKGTTILTNASTSSSSSCNTSDFPVYQGPELKDIDMADLSWISVRHDLTPSDPNYVSLELTFMDGSKLFFPDVIGHQSLPVPDV